LEEDRERWLDGKHEAQLAGMQILLVPNPSLTALTNGVSMLHRTKK
jgi:hypothetical protein